MGKIPRNKCLRYGKRKRRTSFKTVADNGVLESLNASEEVKILNFDNSEHSELVGSDFEWDNSKSFNVETSRSEVNNSEFLCESLVTEKDTTDQSEFKIKGRRIVDIDFFFKSLQEFRHSGDFACTLKNVHITGEKQIGLQCIIFLKCDMCLEKFSVKTTKDENSISDVNFGAVVGITSTGGGFSQLEEITSILDMPCMSSKTFNKIQKTVRESWISTAGVSMTAAVEEEKKAAIERGDIDTDGTPLLTVVTDGCWSKRSYGNNYSALSGAAAIVGFHTKKVIYISIKNKFCLMCETAKKNNQTVRDHDCSANYAGPSTGMEAAAIVEGFKQSESLYGVRYNRFIADGDSAVYKKILDSRPYVNTHIEKIECRNHLFRNFRNKLRNLSKMHKYPVKLRKYVLSKATRLEIGIKKAIQYWKSKTDENINFRIRFLAKDVNNAPYHVFEQHFNCADYFCIKKNEAVNLQNEIREQAIFDELCNSGIFEELVQICRSLSIHANSLIHDVDSNVVEHFHSVVAKFVGGKRVNFSLSHSYTHRCNAALVQFNSQNAYTELSKTVFSKSPNPRVEKMLEKRMVKNKRKLDHQKDYGFAKKPAIFRDEHYGTDRCQKPDLSKEQQELLKKEILNTLKQNQKNRIEIEKMTRDQANCNVWIEKRRNLLTASVFGQVCRRRKKTFGNLVKQILYNDISSISAVKYGKETEELAIEKLAHQLGIKIEKCGLFIDPDNEFLGATPDGIVGDDGLVEVKCPLSAKGMDIIDAIHKRKITFWKIKKGSSEIIVNKSHKYFYQVQGQLNITRRDYCYFAVWTSKEKELKVEKIFRDECFWKENLPKLQEFYYKQLLPEIVDPRYPRNMPIREPDV